MSIPIIAKNLATSFANLFRANPMNWTKGFSNVSTKTNWQTGIPKGNTAILSGRITNTGVKAGVGIGATGAGVGILGLGTQQLIEPLSQVANPIDSLLGKDTGWLLIVGAVILLIVGVLFKR